MNYYIITGTSKGIGKALAEALLQEEHNYVYGVSRNCSISHQRYHHQPLNLSDIVALENNLHKVFPVLKDAEKIVLVNNAGVVGEVAYMGSQATHNFSYVFDVNVMAPAILINTFLSAYHSEKCPKIILNITSGAGKRPVDGWSAYCASKAALDMLSLTVQQEQLLLNNNVRVFSLAPGVVDTAMQDHIRDVDESQFSEVEKFKKYKSSGTLRPPEEVAEKMKRFLDNYQQYKEVVFRIEAIEQ
ncbi:SDR family NAD(P)-dependent oxidoreductase [Adhaeribacter radiodurans]|uniref:SDR family NAD(P)-dependent oxidoreductase n=1 Tax=Adhaeribacter radiodurans TaxID=2745197 RepID=A0A7L7LAF6_9BACT|nr:SDR family NAD(P)-dependent oxidoreductase [Adhaeribacter radiodurans]QMU29818.1 SDR family NAD(P)-dependent oxidoreductase [Adhaeribacter radiodurans]